MLGMYVLLQVVGELHPPAEFLEQRRTELHILVGSK